MASYAEIAQNKSVEPISYYLEEALQNLDG